MAKQELITSFTPGGDFLAILSPDGTVKVWNTDNGSLFAEWKHSDEDTGGDFSCMACSFIGKKRRKDKATCLVALATNSGDALVVNISAGEILWKSTGLNPGGTSSLFFTKKGQSVCIIGNNGITSEINSRSGELVNEIKLSKKSISSSACSSDEDIVAAVSDKIRILSFANGKELVKFSSDMLPVQYISLSDNAKFIVTSGLGKKQLEVWKCDFSSKVASSGPVLSLRHHPLTIECRNGFGGEDALDVLVVSDTGVAYVWSLKSIFEENVNPAKVSIQASRGEKVTDKKGRAKKNRTCMIAARLHSSETGGQVRVLIAYGSLDNPKFTILDVGGPGEHIVIPAGDDTSAIQENGVPSEKDMQNEEAGIVKNDRAKKKRMASDMDISSEVTLADNGHNNVDEYEVVEDLDEPTMGERLASLNLVDGSDDKSQKDVSSSHTTKPPSADSVHVLLKQALRADDRALLIDCLYRQDEKVIANSVSLLNPSDVLKLLQSLISIIQLRGAILACALPWLRSLLLQHASGIMSQESSSIALNSLYQLIESRVSTFHQAIQLSSCLDLLFTQTVDDEPDENDAVVPYIYEVKDESDEEGSEDGMDTESNRDDDEQELSEISNQEFDGMSD